MLAHAEVDLDAVKLVQRFMWPLRKYFRYEARGFENVPPGPSLVVGNHSGGKLPVDLFLFADAWHQHFGFEHHLRPLMHDVFFRSSKWVAASLKRLGASPAGSDAAARSLQQGHSVLVLPGGDYETYRPWKDRYKIDFGKRSGFAELALRERVPVTPVVTIGSHELFLILSRGQPVARALRMHKLFRYNAFPLILGLPFGLYLGPLPSPWPLPSKIVTQVLAPIRLWEEEADHRAFSVDELPAVRREMQQVVVKRMQTAMNLLASERRFPVLG